MIFCYLWTMRIQCGPQHCNLACTWMGVSSDSNWVSSIIGFRDNSLKQGWLWLLSPLSVWLSPTSRNLAQVCSHDMCREAREKNQSNKQITNTSKENSSNISSTSVCINFVTVLMAKAIDVAKLRVHLQGHSQSQDTGWLNSRHQWSHSMSS